MSDWEVDAKDFARASNALIAANMADVAAPIIALTIRDWAVLVRRKVRQRLSRHRRTGRLQSKVTQTASGVGFEFTETVKSGGPVAHLVAGGVKPHAIRSLKPMPIVRSGGVTTFAQAVQHPGFRGDPYFHKGVEDARPGMDALVVQASEQMVEALKERVER